MNILELQKMKRQNKKISFITGYDYWSAKIIAQSNIDCILVGDSLAMTMYGHNSTIPATVQLITTHIQAVAKGANGKFIVADMPFLSYRKSLTSTMNVIGKLIQAGAHAVKLEGCDGNLQTIKHIVESGVPVMGHIGLMVQSIHQLGGYRIQGKNLHSQKKLIDEALKLQNVGCFAIVLECITDEVADAITKQLSIPTIGIGSGAKTDGQILVLQDLLGVYQDVQPKFVKKYLEGFELIKSALNKYDAEVKNNIFPAKDHTFFLEKRVEHENI